MEATTGAEKTTRPWAVLGIVLLALVLRFPTLGWGFFADDYVHQVVLEGELRTETLGPTSLYDFGYFPREGDPVWESGGFPWWASTDFKARFLRPLTSASLVSEHALFGRDAVGYHVSGLLQFGLLLVLVHGLFRALGVDGRTSALALLLLACEDASLFPVGWIAHRNSLLEAQLVVGALLVAARARPGPAAIGGALALALLATLAKESGVAAFVGVAGLWWSRARSAEAGAARAARVGAALALALALAYLAAWYLAGYGTSSMFYSSPVDAPARFLARLGLLLLAFPLAMVGPYPVDVVPFTPAAAPVFLAVAALAWLLLGRGLARSVREVPNGALLAALAVVTLVPRAGALPADRLFFVPSLLAAPLFAALFLRALAPGTSLARRLATSALAASAFALSGLVVAGRAVGSIEIHDAVRAAVAEAEVPDGARDVVLLQVPSAIVGLSATGMWSVERDDASTRPFVFQMGRRGVRWTREDERTLVIESLDEPFGDLPFESVYLSSAGDLARTETWKTALYEIERLEPPVGPPRKVRVRFARDVDSSDLAFLVWEGSPVVGGRLVAIDPPPPGFTTEVARCARLHPLLP